MNKKLLAGTVIRTAIVLAIAALVLFLGVRHYSLVQPIVYEEHLSDVAVTVDGDELTLKDLSFYVLYEEQRIESEAEVYNRKNTRDFWNLHANGIFFKSAAKKYVMDMAVHDYLFYKGAMEEKMELSEDEKQAVEDSYNDFLDDLILQQLDSGLYDENQIHETMVKIALGEKYRAYLTKRDETTYAGYGYDGYDYENYLKDHRVVVNKSIWDRIAIGDNSLVHKSASGINGHDPKESKEDE